MKLFIFLLLISFSVFAQRSQTINADCLRIKTDGVCVSQTDLNAIEGASSNFQDQLDNKVSANDDQIIFGEKDFQGKLTVTSTTDASIPCPRMSQASRDAIVSPLSGECVYNTDTNGLNVYNGTSWKAAGGGVSKWATSTAYLVDDVVIQSNKFYICLTNHTSGTFATDLAATNWQMLQASVNLSTDATGVLPLANGGTNKNLTATAGRVVYSDADSFELTSSGASGQILQSNGSSAPTFVNKSILNKNQAEGFGSVTEEIQAPNSQLTETSANKYLIETGNKNILFNPSFEDSTAQDGWTSGAGTVTAETSVKIDGEQSLKVVLSSQALSIRQDSTRYQAQFADGVDGLVGAWVKTSLSNIYVCARAAGVSLVSSTFSNCVAVANNNKWAFYQVPTILGATSNGVEVASYNSSGVSVAVTGDVYIDDALVGAFPAKQGTFASIQSTEIQQTANFTNAVITGAATLSRGGSVYTYNSSTGVYTFLQTSNVSASISLVTSSAASPLAEVRRNSTVVADSSVQNSSGYKATATFNGIVNAGETISFLNNSSTQSTAQKISLSASAFGSSIYSASCGANCVDTFSAKISSTGVVSGENVDWINGNFSVSTGTFTGTFNSSIFTVAPNCTASPAGSADNGPTEDVTSVSSSGITVVMRNNAGSGANFAFNLACQKQGADFTATRTIVGSFKEVVTMPSVTKPVTFGASVGSTCSASPCTISQSYGSTITSITRASTGQYTINMTGLNSTPVCQFNATETSTGNGIVSCHRTATRSSTAYGFSCKQGTNFLDYNFEISCIGSAP